jgi:putative iron-dependent peroxidase
VPAWGVIGLGQPLVTALKRDLPGLRAFPALAGPGATVPATQQALWCMLGGDDRGTLFDRTQLIREWLAPALELDDAMDTFLYAGGRDLTGYEDGTENPRGPLAVAAAIVGSGKLAGSSYVAVQRWQHDLAGFQRHPKSRRDQMIGRERESNDELADAPPTAHVKRTAQESFDPPAFILRRSMPWATTQAQGLEFVAYGESLDRYERILRRMVGLEDGKVDALFSFSRPLTGGYYWCPPVTNQQLDLTALGIKAE